MNGLQTVFLHEGMFRINERKMANLYHVLLIILYDYIRLNSQLVVCFKSGNLPDFLDNLRNNAIDQSAQCLIVMFFTNLCFMECCKIDGMECSTNNLYVYFFFYRE